MFIFAIKLQILDEDDIYKSIMFTHREFDEVMIDFSECTKFDLVFLGRLENILGKFGQRLKTVKVWCSVQSEIVELTEGQLLKIIKFLPNVEDLTLRNIVFTRSELGLIENFDLNVHRLRRLVCDYCIFSSPVIFNMIPARTITDLVFTFEPVDETVYQTFFNRQSNIRKLVMFENSQISFEHLHLERLKISSDHNFSLILQQQPELKYIDFAVSWIDDSIFKEICKLEHLETLRTLIDQVSIREFRRLGNGKLKELRIDSYDPVDRGYINELTTMNVKELEKITFIFTERSIPAVSIIELAQNLKRIKYIEVINRSINILTTILQEFQQIDELLIDFYAIFDAPKDVLIVPDNLRHENLKQLIVSNIFISQSENTAALIKLLRTCPNLERIRLSTLTSITFEEMKEIIETHPRLTHLSLDCEYNFIADTIDIIKNAKRLRFFRLQGKIECPPFSVFTYHFEEQFANLKLVKYSTGESELVMKKLNENNFLRPKLMEHF